MKLIDKDALVAKIERRMKKFTHCMNKFYYASNYNEWKLVAKEYKSLVSFINDLEVKEVDLEAEIEKWQNSFKHRPTAMGYKETAKHFFELGVNASK